MTNTIPTCAYGGEPVEVEDDDSLQFRIDWVVKGEAAELLQEMMFDYRTTDPQFIIRYAFSLMAEFKKRGEFLIPDSFDDYGNNMVHRYGKRSDNDVVAS